MAVNLRIIHFNDIYNVEASIDDPVGGATRFVSAIKQVRDQDTLVVFSGDAFNPSVLSVFYRGAHMTPVLRHCGIDVAVLGNHDLDFGLDRFQMLAADTSFPWLMSNVLNKTTGRPLAEGKITYITSRNGVKIGFVGLVERDWLQTLSTISADQVIYLDFVDTGRKLARHLRQLGCDIVIAVTHMRSKHDKRLVEEVEEFDLVLGGHDHAYELYRKGPRTLVKSGTDFKELSLIEMNRSADFWIINVHRIEVDSRFSEDVALKEELQPLIASIESKLDEVLVILDSQLEGRSEYCRTRETNLGNLCADLMVAATDADCAILNSGTLRSNRLHAAGNFTVRDLMQIAPFRDCLVLIDVPGRLLLQVLENSVSQYPSASGRFLQVSGIQFSFDPHKLALNRIDASSVKFGSHYLSFDRSYKVCTKEYIRSGRDGYTCLSQCKVLQGAENCVDFTTVLLNHFVKINKHKDGILSIDCSQEKSRNSHTSPESCAVSTSEFPFERESTMKIPQLLQGLLKDTDYPHISLTDSGSPSIYQSNPKYKVSVVQLPAVEGRIRVTHFDDVS